MVDPSEVQISVESPGPCQQRQHCWGVLGAVIGFLVGPRFLELAFSPAEDELNPIYGACIGAFIGFALERKHSPRVARPALFGVTSAFAGLWLGERMLVTGRDWRWGEDEALLYIYGICIGAGIGFAIDVATSKRSQMRWLPTFSLQTLFAACYIVAVLIYIIRGLLIIHGW